MEDSLKNIGLEDREVKVYLAALELGQSTVLPIAKKAGFKRTYCYDILDSLAKRKLVSYTEVNNRRRYVAADPKEIEQLLRERLVEFKNVLPSLSALYKTEKEKPSVRFYEGALEIKNIYEDLNKSTEILAYGNMEKIEQYYPEFYQFLHRQLKKNKVIRELAPRTTKAIEAQKYYKKPKQEMRFLPELFSIDTDTIIYGDKVAMISYGETVHGLVVESKSIANTQKKIFEVLWKLSS